VCSPSAGKIPLVRISTYRNSENRAEESHIHLVELVVRTTSTRCNVSELTFVENKTHGLVLPHENNPQAICDMRLYLSRFHHYTRDTSDHQMKML
jgi:hypothetical protein